MAPSFLAYPSMSVVRNDDFAQSADIGQVFARHVTSRQLPSDISPVHCTITSEASAAGVRLRFTSSVAKSDGPVTLLHKFFFIDRDESRERRHLLRPGQTEATSELLVHFEEGQERDYCHASVFDGDNRMVATQAVVFQRDGRHVPYPFTEKYVCPLRLGACDLRTTRDADGRRVARFSLALQEVTEPQRVYLAWEAIGVIHREELMFTPEVPEVSWDMPLEDNGELAPGDWVVIAVDEEQRLLAQTLVTLVSAEAAECLP